MRYKSGRRRPFSFLVAGGNGRIEAILVIVDGILLGGGVAVVTVLRRWPLLTRPVLGSS